MSTVETDVLIVGGGPAGVISAFTAAKFDCKVIIIDSKPYNEIGHKVCGDALNLAPVTFLEKNLGIEKPHGEEIADVVNRLIFRTSRVDFPLEGDGYVLNRHPYGQRLLENARNKGVEVRDETKAIRTIVTNGYVNGAIVKNKKTDKEYEIRSKISLDCSGRNFQLRKTLPKQIFPYLEKEISKRDLAATYREIIRLKGDDHPFHNEIYLIYHDEIPEPGYFWLFSKGKNRLNAGIGWFMDQKIDRRMKDHFREALHKYYPEGTYEVEEKGGGQVPTRYPLTNAVTNGFIAAGDSACHANPLSAEGHGPALIAGYYAGLVASKAIKANNYSEKQLWQYNVDVMKHFGLSHTKVQLFTEALNTIKVKGLEFFLKRKILTPQQFVNLHAGKQIGFLETINIAIRAFPRYNILWNLYKISKGAQYFEKLFKIYPTDPDNYPAWVEMFNRKMKEIRG